VSDIQNNVSQNGGESSGVEERKQAEQPLELHLVKAFEQAAVGMAHASLDGRLVWVNKKFCEIVGYTPAELRARTIADLTHPDDLPAYRGCVRELEAGTISTFSLEKRYLRKDGSAVWIHMTGSLVRASAGAPQYLISVVQDISEQKRAEAALLESGERFRLFYEHSPIPYQSLDSEGRFIEVNQALLEALGYAREELLGRSFGDVLAPESLPLFAERFPRFKQRGYVRGAEFTLVCKDGRRLVSVLDGNIGYTPEGAFQQTHCVWQDITERKRAEAAQARQAQFDALLTQTLARFASVTGAAIDEYIQSSLEDVGCFIGAESAFVILVSPDMERWSTVYESSLPDAPCLIEKYQNIPLGTRPWSEQRVFQGEVVRIASLEDFPEEAALERRALEEEGVKSSLLLPLRGRGEQVIGCVGLRTYSRPLVWSADDERRLRIVADAIANVLERKRVENELQESRQLLQHILDTIPQRVFWKNRELHYLGCNMPFATDAGLPDARAIVGKTDHDLPWSGENAELYRADDRSVMGSGREKLGYEEPQRRLDGTVAWARTSKLPLRDHQGKIFGVLGTYEDITESRQAKEALRQAKEAAEAANRAKDQFIAVLSHELRTPLTPVLATVSALEEHHSLPEGIREDMEVIRRNVELEARLIDDLLDVTRISQGKTLLRKETVDVHACLENTLEICQADIEFKSLKVDLRLDAAEHHVWADTARLGQVFWNLLKNAVKFTPDKGRISLRTSNVDGGIRIEIADTGIGIPPEAMPRIFNAFEQGEQTRDRLFGGLGLGLSIAKALVDLHQGRLTAFSEGTNKGSVFTVELPVAPPVSTPVVGAEIPAPSAPERLRILLVEDHPDTLRILARLLRKWGYGVTTAASVQSALERASEQRPDLLITDLGLPDGDGGEIFRELKARHHLEGIALSGYGTEEDIRKSLENGFAEHLVKPVSFQTLQTAVERLAAKVKNL